MIAPQPMVPAWVLVDVAPSGEVGFWTGTWTAPGGPPLMSTYFGNARLFRSESLAETLKVFTPGLSSFVAQKVAVARRYAPR